MKVGINVPASGDRGEDLPEGVAIIKAPEAWQYTRGAGVTVAILSAGIYAPHEDLDVKEQISFSTAEPDPQDHIGHGTHVAGMVAARRNSIGIIGVAPEASLISVKVLSSEGSGSIEEVNRALHWCAAVKPDVIILDFGSGGECGSEIQDKLLALAGSGSIVLSGPASVQGSPLLPGCCKSIISVGSQPDQWYSDKADLYCWAGRMKTTAVGGGYAYWSSRAASVGLVSGAVALVKSRKPAIKVDEMRELLMTTSDDAGIGLYPYRQVNVFTAVQKMSTESTKADKGPDS